jgi:hypothetical protein
MREVLGNSILWLFYRIVPLAIILVASATVASSLHMRTWIGVVLATFGGLLVMSLWVPNPTLYWPNVIHGKRTYRTRDS